MPPEGVLLTAQDVADFLKVSKKSVLRWAEAGKLASVRLGDRTVRFESPAVASFVAGNRSGSSEAGGSVR